MKTTLTFLVQVPKIEGVPVARWREYIKDAVQSWAGQFEPVGGGYSDGTSMGDPMGPPCDWNKQVKVTRKRKHK